MRHRKAKDLVHWERRYPAGQRGGYGEYVDHIKALRDGYYQEFLDNKRETLPSVDEIIAAFGEAPPEEFSRAYDVSDQDLEGRLEHIQRKYLLRFKNIRRSWSLLLQFMPELMSKNRSLSILEMSTAHGATLEILRHFGHVVTGNDYANFLGRKGAVDTRYRRLNEFDLSRHMDDHGLQSISDDDETGNGMIDWPYRPIIESVSLDVDLFDAGRVPYPYKDNSFDCVICMDAIEHYCHPLDWMGVVDEFTRISQQSVLLITNPVQKHRLDDAQYMNAFYSFQQAMRQYDKRGFQCIHAGIRRNQLTTFKLAKLA